MVDLREPRKPNYFQYVPDKVLVYILAFLSPHDLCNVSTVCKSWSHLTKLDSLWREHVMSHGFKVGESEAEDRKVSWKQQFIDIATSQVYMFGHGSYGQLGLGDQISRTAPTRVTRLDGLYIRQISLGYLHSALVTHQGECLTWGWGYYDQLGHTGMESFDYPKNLASLQRISIRQTVCGSSHTVFLSFLGDVYTCGQGKYGALGHGDWYDKMEPTRVTNTIERTRIVQVACSNHYTAVLSAFGEVYTWGKGSDGQLGHYDTLSRSSPQMVEGLERMGVCQLVCAQRHMMALLETGEVLAWGTGADGRLGNEMELVWMKPEEIPFFADGSGDPVVQISAFKDHCAALTKANLVYTWGANPYGQLGHGDRESRDLPTLVESLENVRISQVACGGTHTLFLTEQGTVFSAGFGDFGQLGLNDGGKDHELPARVPSLGDKRTLEISCGDSYSAIIASWQSVDRFGGRL